MNWKLDKLFTQEPCLKFSLLLKMSHVMRVILTCVSKIESDGCDFCNHTMQQSLLGALECSRLIQVFHSDLFIVMSMGGFFPPRLCHTSIRECSTR